MSNPQNFPSAPPPSQDLPPPYNAPPMPIPEPPPPGFNVNNQAPYPMPTQQPKGIGTANEPLQQGYPPTYVSQPGYGQQLPGGYPSQQIPGGYPSQQIPGGYQPQQYPGPQYGYQQAQTNPYGYQQPNPGYSGPPATSVVYVEQQHPHRSDDGMKDCCLFAMCMALCCFCCAD